MRLPKEAEVLGALVAWAEARPPIRALILTSTRAAPDDQADLLSDYDVILAARDAPALAATNSWTSGYGLPLVRWGDEHELFGTKTYFRGVIYDDGVRIDYTVWPESLLERVSEASELPSDLDVGYRVLVDKDGVTASWRPPAYRAHIPQQPTRGEYEALVHEFWWDVICTAKGLWRGEIVFAKFSLDYDAKLVALRRFLEWRIEVDHGWAVRPGAYGRRLERMLPPELWSELAAAYVGVDVDENWNALFRTTALFRRVATEVGDALGYAYPRGLDTAVTAHLEAVRALPRDAGSDRAG
jgi:aminoglycoside 6-adenylyltransferase